MKQQMEDGMENKNPLQQGLCSSEYAAGDPLH